MIAIPFLILLFYIVLIGFFIFGFQKIKSNKPENLVPKTSFSIVVPFRNEAENLPKLLHSISLLKYPKNLFEVILIDDESEEEFSLFNSTRSSIDAKIIQNIRKTNSPKKDAIETAVQVAKNNWIITTDADCLVQENWLTAIDQYIQKKEVKMVGAGVCYLPQKGFLHAFQNLDFLSLQGATIGGFGIGKPFMCNGANFAYLKAFFKELNGFEGNETIASGDDVFLLQKAVKKYPKKVGFCNHTDSIVATKSETTWFGLFQQRVRWAAKSSGYTSVFGKTVALLVFTINLMWIILLFLWLIAVFNSNYFMLFVTSKFLIDFILLSQTAHFFKTKITWVLASSILYPFFSSIVALYAVFGNYTWKTRRYKK